MTRLARTVVVSLLAVLACNERNPLSCDLPENADKPQCGGAGGPCKSGADCAANPGSPVCDLMENGGTCVQCTTTDHALCTDTTPHCGNHVCVGCIDDNDCGGTGVCLSTGDCAVTTRIIHAKVSGSTTSGCGAIGNECTLIKALTEVTSTKDVIKLDDTSPYSADMSFVVGIDVTIDARGAVLHRNNDGPILVVNGGKMATILGGTIEGARGGGGGGDGIQCQFGSVLTVDGVTIATNEESGIDASDCTLEITRAIIRDNSKKTNTDRFAGINVVSGSVVLSQSRITATKGGGISISNNAKFIIVSNAFLNNGDLVSNTGGISISTSPDAKNRLEFNTIAANLSAVGDTSGVRCSSVGFVARNNIIWNNPGREIDGSCSHGYSDISPGTVFTDAGNNIRTDPRLVNESSDPHLQSSSPARQAADPQADLTGIASRDIDDQPRTARADMGADQMQ